MRSHEGTAYRFSRIIVAAFFLFLAGGLIPGSLQAATQTFSNTASITIPDSGAGIPYPSTINVSGMTGTVTNVTVTLNHLNHSWASDVDLLLKGPAGQKVLLLSDVGDGFSPVNVNVTLSDAASQALPDIGAFSSGTYRTTDYSDPSPGGDDFPSPAPTPPYAALLSAFNGTNPNGTWSLYVYDDGPGDFGNFGTGWSLTITTTTAGPLPPTISNILDRTTPAGTSTGAIPFTVSDPDTPVGNLTLSGSSNNTSLVPNANIVFGGSGANRTVTVTPTNNGGVATITVIVSDGTNTASDSFVLTVDGPPTISNILNRTINEDTSTGAIAFTVGDGETPAGSLTVSGSSDNTTLVPDGNIVFGGSGANRTVTVTPAADQNGIATITVSVSDGGASTSDTFLLTVNPVDDPPNISDILDRTIYMSGTTGPVSFTVEDPDNSAASLTVSGSSNNTTLVPNGNIVFGGSGANRTVTVTPAAGQVGTATITVTVSDGQLTANDTFVLSVAVNTAPTIQPIANQTAYIDQPTIVRLELADGQTPVTDLLLSLSTDNPTLIRPEDYEFHFFFVDGHRYITLAGAFGLTGSANITITVSDGILSANTSFQMTILPPPANSARFATTAGMTIPDIGPASVYPSVVNVSGMIGTITKLELTVSRFTHEFTDDLSMLLVGPTGVKVVFFSHVGGGHEVNSATFTVSDSALFPFDDNFQIWSEVFRPTVYGSIPTFPAPAPGGPYAPVAFSSFNGLSANGNWSLYVYDEIAPDHGQITGGWSLLITTTGGGSPTPTVAPSPTSTATATFTPTATATFTPTATATFTPTATATFTSTATATFTPTATATFTPTATATFTPTATATFTPTATATFTPTATATFTPTATATFTPTATATFTPTATATATATAVQTPTPTPTPINISGTISYCSNPAAPPVPDVTLNLTGEMTASTQSNGFGGYEFLSLVHGGSYTVTPTKSGLLPTSANINTVDVIATQRHFLGLGAPLSQCRLTAADVDGVNGVNTVDVIGIQRFFLGFSTGIGNSGKYKFNPVSRSYPALTNDQFGQDYDALIFGDVSTGFVYRPEGAVPNAHESGTSRDVVATMGMVSLPNVVVRGGGAEFITQVKTSTINPNNKFVGFQGDFSFDERVITFQNEPVQKAGITQDNWNVSGNVLPGGGPIRILRVSAYSNDFVPLSGEGTLFELRVRKVSQSDQSTQLLWARPPNQFIFIDADLGTHEPSYEGSGSVVFVP